MIKQESYEKAAYELQEYLKTGKQISQAARYYYGFRNIVWKL